MRKKAKNSSSDLRPFPPSCHDALPRERETPIQRSIMARLAMLGIWLERRNVGAARYRNQRTGKQRFVRFARPGAADLWGLDWPQQLPWGRHWEIETKRPGNKPSELQQAWLWKAHCLGCVAFWTDSARVAEDVTMAILAGGRIVWRDRWNYDVDMP
jgi:hypothetical protein